ncbi:penicillin-binding transpeptidase domain-containing protein [Paraflavisolibacter sp. H34]|uniref:penicillin-binding transpeptidase domain-containing protein n=1 Tax=Huijunlia imazamoxiresistens TaxID=3127457 RepID=UPI0030159652
MKSLLIVLSFSLLLLGCTSNNVNVDNSLEKYFKEAGAEGSFALLDNGTGEITVYNLSRYRDSLYLPASTFKIVNALIGLQTGVITNDSMVIKWDGVTRSVPEWNKDLTMYEAFRASAVPYFQEVARRIGKDTMQRWLDSLSYGTHTIKTRVDSFWLDNSLKIRPDEQLGLVKRLYFDQLPFHRLNQEKVKSAMLFERNSQYSLSYKTGLGFRENGNQLAWVIGWVEENKHPYFFVLNMEAPKNTDLVTARMKALKSILLELGFLKGNR